MPLEFYGLRILNKNLKSSELTLRVFVTDYESWPKQHPPLPSDPSFFLRALYELHQKQKNGGILGALMTPNEFENEYWINRNCRQFILSVEQLKTANYPGDKSINFYDSYYVYEGAWEDEYSLIQADYSIKVSDVAYIERLRPGLSIDSSAYESQSFNNPDQYDLLSPNTFTLNHKQEELLSELKDDLKDMLKGIDEPESLDEFREFCLNFYGTTKFLTPIDIISEPISNTELNKALDYSYPKVYQNWLSQYGNDEFYIGNFSLFNTNDIIFKNTEYYNLLTAHGFLPFGKDDEHNLYLFDVNGKQPSIRRILTNSVITGAYGLADIFNQEYGIIKTETGFENPNDLNSELIFNDQKEFDKDSVLIREYFDRHLVEIKCQGNILTFFKEKLKEECLEALARYDFLQEGDDLFADFKPNWQKHHNRGCDYAERKNEKLASLEYKKALKIHPNGNTYHNLAGVSSDNLKAIEYSSKAISHKPNFSSAYNNRSYYYYLNKEYNKALKDINKSISIDDSREKTYGNKAQILLALGDMEGFYENIEMSMKLGGSNEYDGDLLQKFANDHRFQQLVNKYTPWNPIKLWLNQNTSGLEKELNPGALELNFEEAEKILSISFTDLFKEAYQQHNGQNLKAPALLPCGKVLSLDDMIQQWKILTESLKNGEFDAKEANPDNEIKEGWYNEKWIPIVLDGKGNYLCMDMDPDAGGKVGQIIKFSLFNEDRDLIAESIFEWLKGINSDLLRGKYRFDTSENEFEESKTLTILKHEQQQLNDLNELIQKRIDDLEGISSIEELHFFLVDFYTESKLEIPIRYTAGKNRELWKKLESRGYPEDFVKWHQLFGGDDFWLFDVYIESTDEVVDNLEGYYDILTANNYLYFSSDSMGNCYVFDLNTASGEIKRVDHSETYYSKGDLEMLYSVWYDYSADKNDLSNPHNLDPAKIRDENNRYIKDSEYIQSYFAENLETIQLGTDFLTFIKNQIHNAFFDVFERFKNIKEEHLFDDLNPDWEAYNNKGHRYFKKDLLRAAIIQYKKSIQLNPNTRTYQFLGEAYSDLGQREKAIDYYTKAIELYRENATAYNNRSFCHFILGNYEAALADINKAIELEPEHKLVHATKAEILGLLDDDEGFYQALEVAISRGIDPKILDQRVTEKYGKDKRYKKLIRRL
ncbi:MAG: tetratricopeptide repeat protein [Flavobacteriales bacterium]|nr:tetratricopeptide repeat protein [Flavobacteriales bacterium]